MRAPARLKTPRNRCAMPNDPLFDDPEQSARLAKDPQVIAMVERSRWVRLVAGLILLVVLAVILLTSVFR